MSNHQNTEELILKCEEVLVNRSKAIKEVFIFYLHFSFYKIKEIINNKKIIDFNNCQIDDIDASTISLCLIENKKCLQVFQMNCNDITDIGLIEILSNLIWCINLQEIYFGNNKYITEIGINALLEVLPIFTNLKILGLNNSRLNDEDAILLSYNFDFPNLEILFLNNNEITDQGLICLK